ncbi:MAG: GNAT family N-acetyltransferase [bacterium]
MTIRAATVDDIALIQKLTRSIWPVAYSSIITKDQIDYMLGMMYSSEALDHQMKYQHHQFLICYADETPVGFASFGEIEQGIFKLHKLYVLPDHQRKGVGKCVIDHIERILKTKDATALDLNVNRHNPAKYFYEKLGFIVMREEDIDIGSGFWMNDYVMRKNLMRG